MSWRYFHKGWVIEWINESINEKVVCRTAPATPGLLNRRMRRRRRRKAMREEWRRRRKCFNSIIPNRGRLLLWRNVLSWSIVQCSEVQCSVVQCSAVKCSAVQCSVVQCCAVPCSAVQNRSWQRGQRLLRLIGSLLIPGPVCSCTEDEDYLLISLTIDTLSLSSYPLG